MTALVTLTGFQAPFIQKVLRRARKNRIVVGQTIRTYWDDDRAGEVALIADSLVVGTDAVLRVPNKKRSEAARARTRTPETKPRRPRVTVAAGAMFTPKHVHSDPRYLHADYEKDYFKSSS